MFDNFKHVKDQNILVIGDIILDYYIHGKTTRISPEAPVPVVLSQSNSYVLGGAANVAANLNSLGARSFLIGCVGNDENGAKVIDLTKDQLEDASGIIITNKITTTKTRVVSKGQQLLRIDNEDISYLSKEDESVLFKNISKTLERKDFNGVVLQDYNKGLFSEKMISKIINLCHEHKIPVFVDPKHKNFWKFKGITIFKPNLSEILTANKERKFNSIEELIKLTYDELECKILMCTMADEGIICAKHEEITKTPTQKIDVVDVSGAGDSALAMIVISYLLGYDTKKISILANLCGAVACMKSGVSAVTLEEVRSINKSV